MTRKDYLLITKVLREQHRREELHGEALVDYIAVTAVYDVAQELAAAMHRDNPRFDRAHFLSVVRGEKELTSKPQSKPSCCISDGCGRSFDPNMEETRPHETLRPFWMRYCHRHRVTGKLYPAIVEKTQ